MSHTISSEISGIWTAQGSSSACVLEIFKTPPQNYYRVPRWILRYRGRGPTQFGICFLFQTSGHYPSGFKSFHFYSYMENTLSKITSTRLLKTNLRPAHVVGDQRKFVIFEPQGTAHWLFLSPVDQSWHMTVLRIVFHKPKLFKDDPSWMRSFTLNLISPTGKVSMWLFTYSCLILLNFHWSKYFR